MVEPLNDLYIEVADRFAQKIKNMFASEESLQKTWEQHHENLPFDRTTHWNTLLANELELTWAAYGPAVHARTTAYDREQILRALHFFLDFNLFTQVLANLQPFRFFYAAADAQKARKLIEAKWAGITPSPTELKAKMIKKASKFAELDHNRDLSTLKALRIIEGISPFASFRVSPIGSTPALVDSANLSSLGVGGDQFLKLPASINAFYLTWEAAPPMLQDETGGGFSVTGLPYRMFSKSGGEILNDVLFSRKVAYDVFGALMDQVNGTVVLPRLTSLLVITTASEVEMRLEVLPKVFHREVLTLHVGVRGNLTTEF